ncbi:hypothetical protein C8Q73DRAFT_178580 [Cubamyces lactineus]|nr:hypothetical protein C8Q73DRAFT_178580 [Cubamyces lactineus]
MPTPDETNDVPEQQPEDPILNGLLSRLGIRSKSRSPSPDAHSGGKKRTRKVRIHLPRYDPMIRSKRQKDERCERNATLPQPSRASDPETWNERHSTRDLVASVCKASSGAQSSAPSPHGAALAKTQSYSPASTSSVEQSYWRPQTWETHDAEFPCDNLTETASSVSEVRDYTGMAETWPLPRAPTPAQGLLHPSSDPDSPLYHGIALQGLCEEDPSFAPLLRNVLPTIQLSEADPYSEGLRASSHQREEDQGADADEDIDDDEGEGEDEDEDENGEDDDEDADEKDELDEDEEKLAPRSETHASHEPAGVSVAYTSPAVDPDPNLVPTQPNSPVLGYCGAALLSASISNAQASHLAQLTEAEVGSILSDAAAIARSEADVVLQERHGLQAPVPLRHTSPPFSSEYDAERGAEHPGLPAIVVASPTPPHRDSPSTPPAGLSYLAPTPVRTRGRPRKTVVDYFDEEIQEQETQQRATLPVVTPPPTSTPPQVPGGLWANMDKQSITALPPTSSPSFDMFATHNMSSAYDYYSSVVPPSYQADISSLCGFAMSRPDTIFNSAEDDSMDVREDSFAGPLITYQYPSDPPARPPLPPPPPPPSSHPILLPTIPQIHILPPVVPHQLTPQPLYTPFVATSNYQSGGDMELDGPEPLGMDWAEVETDVEMTQVLEETYHPTYHPIAMPAHIYAPEQQVVLDATVARVDPAPPATIPNDALAVYSDSFDATSSPATLVALDATSVPEAVHPQTELDTAPRHADTIDPSNSPPSDANAVAVTTSVPDATPAAEASTDLTPAIGDAPSIAAIAPAPPPLPVVAVVVPTLDYLAPPPGEVEASTVDSQTDDDDEDDDDEDDPSQWEVVVAPLTQSQPVEQPAEASQAFAQVAEPINRAPTEIPPAPVEEVARTPTPQPSLPTPSPPSASATAVDTSDAQRRLAETARVSGGPYSRRGGPSGWRRAIMERERSKKLIESIKADLGLMDESPREQRGGTPATTTQPRPTPASTTDCAMDHEPAEQDVPALRLDKGKGRDTNPTSHVPEVPMSDVPPIAPEISEELVKSLLTPEELALNSNPTIWAQFRPLKSPSAPRPAARDLDKPGSSRQHGSNAMQDVPAVQVGSIVKSASLSPARDKGHDALPLPGKSLVDVPAVSHVQPQHTAVEVEKSRPAPGPLDWDDEVLTTSPIAEKWQPIVPSPVKDVFGFASKPSVEDTLAKPTSVPASGLDALAAAASSIEVSAYTMERDDDDDEDFPEPLWKRSVSKPTVPKEQRPMRQLPKRAAKRNPTSSYSSLAGALDESRVLPSAADVGAASEPPASSVTPSEPEPPSSGSQAVPEQDEGERPPSPCISLYSEDGEPAHRIVNNIAEQPAAVPMADLEQSIDDKSSDKEANESPQDARAVSAPSSTLSSSQDRSADEHDVALALLSFGAASTSSEVLSLSKEATDLSPTVELQQLGSDAHETPSAEEERLPWSPPACVSPPVFDGVEEQDVAETSALDSMDTAIESTLSQVTDETIRRLENYIKRANDTVILQSAQMRELNGTMPMVFDGVHASVNDLSEVNHTLPEEPMTGQIEVFDTQDATISDAIPSSEAEFEAILDVAMAQDETLWPAPSIVAMEPDASSSSTWDLSSWKTSRDEGGRMYLDADFSEVDKVFDAIFAPPSDIAAPAANCSADDTPVAPASQDVSSIPQAEQEHVLSLETETLAEVHEVEQILFSSEGGMQASDAADTRASGAYEVASHSGPASQSAMATGKDEDAQAEEASPAANVVDAEEVTKDPRTEDSVRAAIGAPDVLSFEGPLSSPSQDCPRDHDGPSYNVPPVEPEVTPDSGTTTADTAVSEAGECGVAEIRATPVTNPPASTEAEAPDLISFDDPPVDLQPVAQISPPEQPTPAVLESSPAACPSSLDDQPAPSEQELPTIVITAPSECGEPEGVDLEPETPPPAEEHEPSPSGSESEQSVEPCSSPSPSPPSSPTRPRRIRASLPPAVSKNVLRFILGGEASELPPSPYQKLTRAERRVKTRQSRRKRRDQLRNVPEALLDEIVSSEMSSSASDSPSSESDSSPSPTRGIEEPLVPYWYVTHVRRVAEEAYAHAPRPIAPALPALPSPPRVEREVKVKAVQTDSALVPELLPRVPRPYRSLPSRPLLRPPQPAPEPQPKAGSTTHVGWDKRPAVPRTTTAEEDTRDSKTEQTSRHSKSEKNRSSASTKTASRSRWDAPPRAFTQPTVPPVTRRRRGPRPGCFSANVDSDDEPDSAPPRPPTRCPSPAPAASPASDASAESSQVVVGSISVTSRVGHDENGRWGTGIAVRLWLASFYFSLLWISLSIFRFVVQSVYGGVDFLSDLYR